MSESEDRSSYWEQHITGWEAGKLSQNAYCEEQKISHFAFKYWRQRLKRPSADGLKFIKMTQSPSCNKPATPVLQIMLPNGVRIGMSHETNVELIREIFVQLGAMQC